MRIHHATAVAYVALFVALGGSAYAVTQINGRLIINRSISGSKLQRHTVAAQDLNVAGVTVPRALVANTAADLHLAGEKRGRRALARVASATDASSTAGLVGLIAGQSQTLFTAGPFTLSATCSADPSGGYRTVVDVTSSVAGWVMTGGPTPQPADVPVEIDDDVQSTPQFAPGPGVVLASPSGSVALGPISLGENLLGFDCLVDAYAIGS